MKKIATLLLAAGLLFSAAGMAQAIDFKILHRRQRHDRL